MTAPYNQNIMTITYRYRKPIYVRFCKVWTSSIGINMYVNGKKVGKVVIRIKFSYSQKYLDNAIALADAFVALLNEGRRHTGPATLSVHRVNASDVERLFAPITP